MNQEKIGMFLKSLRKEKGLTQEQFAEVFNVSNRTVSRWENGNNMPDLDVLIDISDYYEVELREILDGERKSENMNKDLEETVLKAVDYSSNEADGYIKKVHWLLLVGIIFWFVSQIINHTELIEVNVIRNISEFAEGASCGLIICGLIATSRYERKIKAFKQRLLKRQ